MDAALLQNLLAGAGSPTQLVGGLIIAILYVVVGLLGRYRKHSCFSTNVPGPFGTDILGFVPGRDCGFLPELRGVFRSVKSCLAN